MAHHIKPAERGQVELRLRGPCPGLRIGRSPRRHEPDGPRHYGRDQELVVEGRGPPGLVRVDGDVLGQLLLLCAVAAEMVGAVAPGPVRIRRLSVAETPPSVPVRTRRLYPLKVRVALDLLLWIRGRTHVAGCLCPGGAVGLGVDGPGGGLRQTRVQQCRRGPGCQTLGY